MKYRTKRGRPKSSHSGKDYGTPELIIKRQIGITSEPLDLCLERGIITIDEHWAGIHLRWLYTIIFGAPTVSASDPSSLGGKNLRTDDSGWLHEREQEYSLAQITLRRLHALPLVPDVCIFNHLPRFLLLHHNAKNLQSAIAHSDEYQCFRDGLNGLFKVFSGKR